MKKVYVIIDSGDFRDKRSKQIDCCMEHVIGAYMSLDVAKKEIKGFLKEQIKNYKEDQDTLDLEEAKIFDLRKSLPIDKMINDRFGFCYIDSSFECDYIRIIEVEIKED